MYLSLWMLQPLKRLGIVGELGPWVEEAGSVILRHPSLAFSASDILGHELRLERKCCVCFWLLWFGTDGVIQPELTQFLNLPVSCLPSLGRGLRLPREANVFCLDDRSIASFGIEHSVQFMNGLS